MAKRLTKSLPSKSRRKLSVDEIDQLAAQNEELQNAQGELEESRNQYAELFDHAPIAYITLTARGEIVRVNFSAALLLGRSREMLKRTLITMLAGNGKELKKILEHLRHCRAEEINVRTPLILKNFKGNVLFVELVSHPVAGTEHHFHTALIDLTAQKKIENDLVRARDEALAAARAKDDFLAALSHELRTPLNPVLLVASEAAADPALPAPVRGDFEMIRKNVELEARLIDDLLDLTRITHGKLAIESGTADLHVILRDSFATVQKDIEQKKITTEWNLAEAPQIISGDPVRLQQIFWNVFKNAMKFTPENGKIFVTTAVRINDIAIVKIADTGIGMTAAELARVFSAFSQGDHAGDGNKHRFGGLGLGLAISKMLAELHHGTIRAESDGRGHGATFILEFPLVKIAREKIISGAEKNSAPPAPAKTSKSPIRILLVEDHEPTRLALQQLLRRRHYEVVTAASFSEAKKIAAQNNFELLISDIGLPDGNGYDLMAEFQQSSSIKGIALTGYGMEEDLARSKKAGFTTHLIKPIRADALENALAAALRA